MNERAKKWLLLLWATSLMSTAFGEGEFIAPEEFLQRVFPDAVPASQVLWISGDIKAEVENILGHEAGFLRLRYWGDSERSAWIVDEIGKTEPITIGLVVSNKSVESVDVLAFRESRGWEIKYEFFTRQFAGVSLSNHSRLDRSIDGISGATLSVKAVTNVSRLVLYLAASLSS